MSTNLLHDGTEGEITNPLYVILTDGSGGDAGSVLAVPVASETHLGQVSAEQTFMAITPVVSTTPAYTSGDCIGGKMTLANAARIDGGITELTSLTLIDKGNQKPQGTLIFFDSDPTTATITDNAAFGYGTAISKYVGQVSIVTADWTTINSIATATKGNLGIKLKTSGGPNLYAVFVTTSAPTFLTTSDIIAKFGFTQ